MGISRARWRERMGGRRMGLAGGRPLCSPNLRFWLQLLALGSDQFGLVMEAGLLIGRPRLARPSKLAVSQSYNRRCTFIVGVPRQPRRGAQYLLFGDDATQHREKRAAHSLIPPLRRMNRSKGSESRLYTAAYLITRDHLLLVRLSAFSGSAVHRMTTANGSSRSNTSNRCKRRARRARSISWPSAVHQATRSLPW
jgi:hypothetical protein